MWEEFVSIIIGLWYLIVAAGLAAGLVVCIVSGMAILYGLTLWGYASLVGSLCS